MYGGLVHAHSGWRWIVLILILAAIINAVRSQNSGRYEKKDKLLNLFAMVSLHIQLLIGLALFFINERSRIDYSDGWLKDYGARFYGLEHIITMVLAIAIITFGRKKAESLVSTRDRHRRILLSYILGLIIILASIPWPFSFWKVLGGQWA